MAEIAISMPKCIVEAKDLSKWEGKNIADICDAGYTNDNHNHCAHFVGHALNYAIGYTCKRQTGKGKLGASLRANELFAQCIEVGKWADRPPEMNGCLAFVTSSKNVNLKRRSMTDHPRKHIGVYLDGSIWHYSNSNDKVMVTTPDKFGKHYSGSDVTLYYGRFPISCAKA